MYHFILNLLDCQPHLTDEENSLRDFLKVISQYHKKIGFEHKAI